MISRMFCRRPAFSRPWGGFGPPLSAFFLVLGILTVLGDSRPAAGQARAAGGGALGSGLTNDRTVPTQAYHATFVDFYDGDYRTALDNFKTNSLASIKNGQSRWIDSICYETMQGECYYQMGIYGKALTCYTNALELFQAYPMWLSQVQFQPIRADSGSKKPPPWQVRRLQAPLGQLPPSMLLAQGQIDASQVVRQGGVYQPANLMPVEARDRPLHGVGHPPPRRVAGTAGRPRSPDGQRHRLLAASGGAAQPLVGGPAEPGTGDGPVGRGTGDGGPAVLAKGDARLGHVRASADRHGAPGTWPAGHDRR